MGFSGEPIRVKRGQEVVRGEVIGLIGKTGRATGNHLHFAYFKDGQTANPLDYLPSIPMAFSDTTFGTAFGYGDWQ